MAKDTLEDTLTVKAPVGGTAAAKTAAPKTSVVPDAIIARGEAAVKSLAKRLEDVRRNKMAKQQAMIEEAGIPPASFGLLWDLATYGPIQFDSAFNPNPDIGAPNAPNSVIEEGNWAGLIGVSYAGNPLTAAHLLGKDFTARFTFSNLTTMLPGLGGAVSDPLVFDTSVAGSQFVYDGAFTQIPNVPGLKGRFTPSALHFFVFYFQPVLSAGSEADLYDVNFTVDISSPGARGAGFANWHYNPDSATGIPGPISLPGDGWSLPNVLVPGTPLTAPQWRNAISGRFMVNRFPA